ncbi:methyltransferase [Roseovarius sp. S88]|uniref:Methyltransferase n=1 Tax=Roseovarius phycicola TaxID=3080976 RepID=A0ABZ2HLV7_9RHOB
MRTGLRANQCHRHTCRVSLVRCHALAAARAARYGDHEPPFHTGRASDPDLGRAFIRAAAEALKPKGQLWMVANRHLPYEAELGVNFRDVKTHASDNRFKILWAANPARKG